MNTNDTPQVVYVTGPRNGSSYAALTLGILSVCLIFIPLISTVMAITAVILGSNGAAAAKAGIASARAAALWGVWLGVANCAVWGVIILIWQLGSSIN